MIRIKMVYRKTIWTSLGREMLYTVTYSDGLVQDEWYIVHHMYDSPFLDAEKRF